MTEVILAYINPIKIVVFATVVIGFMFLKQNVIIYKYLKFILLIYCITELSPFFVESLDLVYTISFIAANVFWLLILREFHEKKILLTFLIGLYLVLSVINFFFFEKKKLNYNTFIFGAFLYVIIFIQKSFYELKNENFSFFESNNFKLLISPIIFFMGLSFLFGFRNKELLKVNVFFGIDLYSLIETFVNGVYYLLLLVFIFREKNKNAY